MSGKWRRVSKREPCPRCGRKDWCAISDDAVICMRVESSKQVKTGAGIGYLHRLSHDVAPRSTNARPVAREAEPTETPNWGQLLARYRAATVPGELRQLADRLGVSVVSLQRLGCCWAPDKRAWAFAMRDPAGEVVGIRLRSDDGRKWAVKGSHQGLFTPDDGTLPDLAERIFIVEGPTDAAALLDLGFVVVGRPSCTGSADDLAVLLAKRDVVIIGDNDPVKTAPDGRTFRPGHDGAYALADRLVQPGAARSVRVIFPLEGKDMRDWKRGGCDACLVNVLAQNCRPYQKKGKKPLAFAQGRV